MNPREGGNFSRTWGWGSPRVKGAINLPEIRRLYADKLREGDETRPRYLLSRFFVEEGCDRFSQSGWKILIKNRQRVLKGERKRDVFQCSGTWKKYSEWASMSITWDLSVFATSRR
ncbi:hypothetical protein TNIN_64541 [Trichonephila inaurata madagascariensis]|uniref:Uncharacterized protein n=1 Tax=Trichonephila inaurata madagascariensis TaxID=2747483 RepID=A0A8X6YMP1_9ARAC|nr:hypothetical protein TNIN_64541 [Trichonephila inaurata madagascariensis]